MSKSIDLPAALCQNVTPTNSHIVEIGGAGQVYARKLQDHVGVTDNQLPKLGAILDNSEAGDSTTGSRRDDLPEWARGVLSYVETVSGNKIEVLVVELAVVQDHRQLGGRAPYFVSSIVAKGTDKGNSLQIKTAYSMAIESMGPESVVNDREFHQHAFYFIPSISHRTHIRAAGSATSEFFSCEKKTFSLDLGRLKTSTSTAANSNRVQQFFCSFLDSVPCRSQFDEARLLVVPFQRPSQDKKSRSGNPGGALFIVYRQIDGQPNHESHSDAAHGSANQADYDLAGRLSHTLTRAALIEATDNFELAAQQANLLSNTIHGTVTAIRSVSSDNLWLALFNELDSKNLRFQICNEAGERQIDIETELIRAAQIVRMAENVAAALPSLAEVFIFGGVMKKHQNNVREKLATMVMSAVELVNGQAAGKIAGEAKRINATLHLDLNKWEIPLNYLHHRIITGLILEVLKNVSRYGKSIDEYIPVQIDVRELRDGFELIVQNPMLSYAPEKWVRYKDSVDVPRYMQQTGRRGFLARLVDFCERFSGMTISTRLFESNCQPYFETKLGLGGMRIETDSGISQELVSPNRLS